jgi:three-Cys-motif partner protein
MMDEDGLPLDDVGIWTKEKHERLRKYVDISRGVRRKWVEGTGGATYVDLYCGAGRAVVRETGERIDGSPLVAFRPAKDGKVPFSKIYIADESEENVRIAQQRLLTAGASVVMEVGLAKDTAARIASRLSRHSSYFSRPLQFGGSAVLSHPDVCCVQVRGYADPC